MQDAMAELPAMIVNTEKETDPTKRSSDNCIIATELHTVSDVSDNKELPSAAEDSSVSKGVDKGKAWPHRSAARLSISVISKDNSSDDATISTSSEDKNITSPSLSNSPRQSHTLPYAAAPTAASSSDGNGDGVTEMEMGMFSKLEERGIYYEAKVSLVRTQPEPADVPEQAGSGPSLEYLLPYQASNSNGNSNVTEMEMGMFSKLEEKGIYYEAEVSNPEPPKDLNEQQLGMGFFSGIERSEDIIGSSACQAPKDRTDRGRAAKRRKLQGGKILTDSDKKASDGKEDTPYSLSLLASTVALAAAEERASEIPAQHIWQPWQAALLPGALHSRADTLRAALLSTRALPPRTASASSTQTFSRHGPIPTGALSTVQIRQYQSNSSHHALGQQSHLSPNDQLRAYLVGALWGMRDDRQQAL